MVEVLAPERESDTVDDTFPVLEGVGVAETLVIVGVTDVERFGDIEGVGEVVIFMEVVGDAVDE